jgi:hypothetical protein
VRLGPPLKAGEKLSDRVCYYSDLIGIFDELQIPWRPWFALMSADGSVIPEYREALLLDE